MADTMQFDLVSPERSLASLKVNEVQIPGSEGDLTAMADHAPLITTLRPGVLKISGPEGDLEFVVTGGFAEITAEGTSVLAEHAMPTAEVTQETVNGFVATAEAARESASGAELDVVVKQVSDIAILAATLGFSA